MSRSTAELDIERSYLLNSLHRQDQRGTRLVAKYAALGGHLQYASTSREGKRIRKELRLLKIKISESMNQEAQILGRLGELYIQIRSIERWQVAKNPAVPAQPYTSWSVPDPALFFDSPGSPAGTDSVARSTPCLLSPLSSTFVPEAELSNHIFWSRQSIDGEMCVDEKQEKQIVGG